METCGIVAEFNPFHHGHREMIIKIREIFSDRVGIVAAMSASFTQRGEPALYDISHRVRAALNEGVDLVIEIPVTFVLDSAENFATAGIDLLQSSGVVRNLAYGSEDSDSPDQIKNVASFLATETPDFKLSLQKNIRQGMGFAAARQKAVIENIDDKKAGLLLEHSNSILAVEYEKAIIKSGKNLASHPLPLYNKNKFSASKIRDIASKAFDGRPEEIKAKLLQTLHSYMTPQSLSELIRAHQEQKAGVFLHQFAPLLHCQPIWRNRDALSLIQGMQGGLADRFINHLEKLDFSLNSDNFYDWLDSIATRAFPLSRVRRAFLSAILNLHQKDTVIQYLRILGFTKRGRTLMSYMQNCASLPIISRSADWQQVKSKAGLLQQKQGFIAGNIWKSRLSTSIKVEETRKIVIV